METRQERFRAFLDESVSDGRFYSISAAIIRANDETRVNKQLHDAGLTHFHASKDDESQRRAMETFVLSHSVGAAVSVYAPMKDSVEETRQDCLAALAARLRDDHRHPVTELVMDPRDDLAKGINERYFRPNEHDQATIRELNDGHHAPIRIYFANDEDRLGLKMADAVAWRTRRALSSGSPLKGVEEFARLAPRTVLLAADRPGQRSTLQEHLDAFRAVSVEWGLGRHMAPEQLAALRQNEDRLRDQLIRHVRDGGADWLDYFGSSQQRRPPEPGRQSVWDVFAGKGTTPTIRPDETQTATATVTRADVEAERRRTRAEDTREQRGHDQQRRPAQAEPERTRREDSRRIADRQPDRQRQEQQRRQADQRRDQDHGRGRGLTR